MRLRGRLPWASSSVRLRLLAGLAILLVVGLVASAVISALLLEDFLDRRNQDTLKANAARLARVIAQGPQTADADQLGALLGSPLGTVAVDEDNTVLLSTGSASWAAEEVADSSATAPTGSVVTVEGGDLSAVRIPSPGLSIDRGPTKGTVAPAAVILTIDTSVDDTTTDALIRRQLALIGVALLVLLGLSAVVLRLGMRPLARMARSADTIAAGSLTERLPTHRNGSEADLLAKAVNRAFDAQARAEATVRSLAADTSHELRTPLSTISGWLDLHRQGGLSGPGLETALEHIENEVGRMRLLVEDLALLARLDAGRPVEQDDVDLTVLAAGVIEDAQIIYPQRDIAMAPAPPAPVVGDAARLQQVLRNLVGNAVQHTPARTSVRVEVALSRETVELSVVDNGPGISAEDLPRVFERFWRAEASRSRAYGGSGLGLAIVEAIVHAHRGQVDVHSEVGVGTTVTIRLPRGRRP
ncbi:signal transduction histidine kinase [Streptomyces sp. SAI-135]|uniref:sensor histidine kinase n=1 Tax=unclassified Streptomyces TaxID=2593676 RepID=UPI0024748DBA|nr:MULTISPECIES: HAMP domain-containing sensor histidine kinase [unclassified Streptomyces]MDH6514219.1 signal transduction histidine kinase [Streptomyces sp. SAI-090]MDH6621701.1 signal transduction histidine kinase [Streptomyces sp. SAI-135]